jgi:hypothetical protein
MNDTVYCNNCKAELNFIVYVYLDNDGNEIKESLIYTGCKYCNPDTPDNSIIHVYPV